MNLITAEDAIIAQLSAEIDNVHIQSFPDNPSEFQHVHPNASLLVMYNSSNYSDPISNNQGFLTQDRTPQWVISILTRNLKLAKGQQGSYVFLESIRRALTGFTIPGFSDATIMWPTGDRFVTENQGLWQYQITFVFGIPEHE